MKKGTRKQTARPMRVEKSSIIVLAIAAVIFLAALYAIYSQDFMKGAGEIFSVSGSEVIEFEKATVNEILSEDLEVDEIADGAYVGTQELAVTVKSGRYKGEDMVVYKQLYDNGDIWVRPAKMFAGFVDKDGRKVRRFEYIDTEW